MSDFLRALRGCLRPLAADVGSFRRLSDTEKNNGFHHCSCFGSSRFPRSWQPPAASPCHVLRNSLRAPPTRVSPQRERRASEQRGRAAGQSLALWQEAAGRTLSVSLEDGDGTMFGGIRGRHGDVGHVGGLVEDSPFNID